MGKGLIIVESPTKARTLSKFLGNSYEIKASMGHIRDLPKNTLGIKIEDGFQPQYTIERSKLKIIKELKTSAANNDAIFLASDHDREGEAIAWHLVYALKDVTGDKNIYRITFNEITKKAVIQALENPGKIDQNKVDAQQARRLLDRLVGYKISPLLWKVITTRLSAGRVQSVALRLICEREEEIAAFKQQEYWTVEADFFKDKLPPFHSILHKWQGKKVELATGKEAEEIVRALQKSTFKIREKKSSSRKVQPLPPFITSTLQQEASRIHNYSSKRTMNIAQQLYEGVEIEGDSIALISYMRTDSLRLSQESLETTRNLIGERFGKEKINPKVRTYKNKSSAQDAHEAIRPTEISRTPESLKSYLKPEQLKLYTLIWERTVATQMIPVEIDTVNVLIEAGEGLFKATGGVIREQGFLAVYRHLNLNLGETIHQDYSENDLLETKDLKGWQHFTKPPARYTEASLIKELESKGIGRPSTYSSITSTIQERKYVILKEKKFYTTELGMTVNKFLIGNFDTLFNVTFTKTLEDGLDSIAEGEMNWQMLLEDYYSRITGLIEDTDIKKSKQDLQEETDLLCEKCGKPMIVKWGSKGQFLACSGFPQCKNTKSFKRTEEGSVKIEEQPETDEKCPKDGAPLVVKQGRFGKFLGCSNYPKCKFTKKITLGITCPECKTGEITENISKKGKKYYSCSRYPECKFRSYYKPVSGKCPACGSEYLEEISKSGSDKIIRCSQCKKEMS
jgi:DNA topoisomerase-1